MLMSERVMTSSEKQPSATAHAQAAQGPLAKLLQKHTIEVLHAQIKAMFDCADDTLFDWARRAIGDDQTRCMSLMRVLRVRKPDVVDHFFSSFSEKFDASVVRNKTQKNNFIGELSMQSTEELEESIAVSNMTARAEGLFRDQLFELGRRLEWAKLNRGESIERAAMEPLAICEAFLDASRTIEMEIESRLVVLKLFERTVMIQLGELYHRLLTLLNENGIEAAVAQRNIPREKSQAESSHQEGSFRQEESSYPSAPMNNMLSALGAVANSHGAAGFNSVHENSQQYAAPHTQSNISGAMGATPHASNASSYGAASSPDQHYAAPHAQTNTQHVTGAAPYGSDGAAFGPSHANGQHYATPHHAQTNAGNYVTGGPPNTGFPAGFTPNFGAPTGNANFHAGMPAGSTPFGNFVTGARMDAAHFDSVPPGAYPGGPMPVRAPIGAYGLPLPPTYANYAGYTDANLASELSNRLSAWAQKPQSNSQQEPIAQRADLIGRMFDGFQNDAALPETIKPILETLRFPVLKAALSDPIFLTNTQHPLRVLLHDLATTASSARTSPNDPTANLNSLSAAMAPLLTPDAPVVRANIDNPQPVSPNDVQSFLGHMDEEAASRRKIIVQRGMQRVDEELQRVTEARELLATAELLIDRALRPFLGLTLLRHSIASPLWTQSLNLAERVIRSVDLVCALELSNNDRRQVRAELEDALVLERLPRERNTEAISSLSALHDEIEAFLEQKAPAPQKAPQNPKREAARNKPLRSYLTLGAWFRIYNRKNEETHWMRLLEHERDVDFLVFGGFDVENKLLISPLELEEDLISGRTEPLDPPPSFETALAAYRRKVNDVAADAIAAAKEKIESQRDPGAV